VELPYECRAVGPHRPGLYLPGRAHFRDLQRSAPVLPDRAGIPAAGPARAQGRGRLGRAHRPAQYRRDQCRVSRGGLVQLLAPPRCGGLQSHGGGVVRTGRSGTGAPTSWWCSGRWRRNR
jgi:hypothetical protein